MFYNIHRYKTQSLATGTLKQKHKRDLFPARQRHYMKDMKRSVLYICTQTLSTACTHNSHASRDFLVHFSVSCNFAHAFCGEHTKMTTRLQ